MEVVYVNEYQPSTASLIIGKDPIYKDSKQKETIRIGISIPVAPLVVSGLGLLLWYLASCD